jgi:hypothetical protein
MTIGNCSDMNIVFEKIIAYQTLGRLTWGVKKNLPTNSILPGIFELKRVQVRNPCYDTIKSLNRRNQTSSVVAIATIMHNDM